MMRSFYGRLGFGKGVLARFKEDSDQSDITSTFSRE